MPTIKIGKQQIPLYIYNEYFLTGYKKHIEKIADSFTASKHTFAKQALQDSDLLRHYSDWLSLYVQSKR